MNINIVIVGEFNIDWLNTNGSESRRFCNILETFGFVQNICTETHRSHHLLHYNITRNNIISEYRLGLHFGSQGSLLQCIRPHPLQKHIAIRALRQIKDKFSID